MTKINVDQLAAPRRAGGHLATLAERRWPAAGSVGAPQIDFYKRFTILSDAGSAYQRETPVKYLYTEIYTAKIGAPVRPVFLENLADGSDDPSTWSVSDLSRRTLYSGCSPIGKAEHELLIDTDEIVRKPILIHGNYLFNSHLQAFQLVFFGKRIDLLNNPACIGFIIHRENILLLDDVAPAPVIEPGRRRYLLKNKRLHMFTLSSRDYTKWYKTVCDWNSPRLGEPTISCNCPGWTRRFLRHCKHSVLMQSFIDAYEFIT